MFLWRRSSWISRRSFPTWLRRIVAAEWRSPWAVISPPKRSASGPEPQIERAIGERRPCVSSKHKLRSREGDPSRGEDSSSFEALLDRFPLKERRAQTLRDGHILEDAPLALDPQGHNFFSYCLESPRLTGSTHQSDWRSGTGRWQVGT
jgi:hypothetical protein